MGVQKTSTPTALTNSVSTLGINNTSDEKRGRRDLLFKKTVTKKRNESSAVERALSQQNSVISQMAKKVIEKSSLVAQRRLGGLTSKTIAPTPGKIIKHASDSVISKTQTSQKRSIDLQKSLSEDTSNKSKRLENAQPKGPISSTQNRQGHLPTEINLKNNKFPKTEKGKGLFVGTGKNPVRPGNIKQNGTILVDDEVSFNVNGDKA